MISRAVMSSAMSARQACASVLPVIAAMLNHLCASTKSIVTPSAPLE